MKLSLSVVGETSEKPDVVLIHGTGSSSQMWNSQVSMLTDNGHRCFLIDLRGHGESHEPEEPTNLDVHIEDVLETLEHGGVRYPAAFLGHSLGSIISLTIAERHPELAHTLLLAALPGRVHKPIASVFKILLKGPFQAMRGSNFHSRLAWRERTLLSTNDFSLNQIVDNFHGVDLIEKTPEVDCPVHLSAGRFDPVAPCHHIVRIHKTMPNSTLRIFEMAGHNFMDYNADSFNQWILEKLSASLESVQSRPEQPVKRSEQVVDA